MFLKTAATAIAATALVVGSATAACAQVPPASWDTTDKGLGTWSDFSGMFRKSAGQFVSSGGNYTNQWAYEPQTFNADGSISSAPGAESDVRWGDPANWPPSGYETFKRSGDGVWVLLDGFGDTASNSFLKQRVTKEVISDIDCQTNRTTLPLAEPEVIDGQVMGKQHYTKWFAQPTPYCLEAWGIIEIPGGTNVNFYHRQGYWEPSGPWCDNPHHQDKICLKQYETWEDDNPNNAPGYGPGTQPGMNLIHSRDNILAKGLGQTFIHTNYLADPDWWAYGKAYWSY